MAKIKRPFNTKIRDIKNLRVVTNLLGKLGISGCYHDVAHWNGKEAKRFYGFSLKEAVDYIESICEYDQPPPGRKW